MRNPEGFELHRSIAARTQAVGGISTATPFGPGPARVEDVGLLTILEGFAGTISFSYAVIGPMDLCAAAVVQVTQFKSLSRPSYGQS